MEARQNIPERFDAAALDWDDRVTLTLQGLYRSCGFERYRMSRFEPFDLYFDNRGFLRDANVITFTGPGGKLMALKPDVTLSLVKNLPADVACQKLFYVENVFRIQASSGEFSEIAQVGVEYIGCPPELSAADCATPVDLEVLQLALESMRVIGPNARLVLSHMGLSVQARDLLAGQLLCAVPLDEALAALRALPASIVAPEVLASLQTIWDGFAAAGQADCLCFDLSLVGDTEYYTGITFQGYVEGLPRAVLSGGRYDGLMERFDKPQGACGFAVYLGEISSAFMGGRQA